MSMRWLGGGILLFALGFSSAFLVKLGAAEAQAPVSGEMEKGLRYTVGSELTLTNTTGDKTYLVAVARKGGAEPQILHKAGAAGFSKKDTVYVYGLIPLGKWENGFRPCHKWELCPVPKPLPPPPPPLRISATFLEPMKGSGRPMPPR